MTGESGSGKSTLFNILGGLASPTSGTISIDGKTVTIREPSQAIEQGIGFVTEDEFDLQFRDIYDQVNAFAAGRPQHLVNPGAVAARPAVPPPAPPE